MIEGNLDHEHAEYRFMTTDSPAPPAETKHFDLEVSMGEFEVEHTGARMLVYAPDGDVLRASWVGFRNPDVLEVDG